MFAFAKQAQPQVFNYASGEANHASYLLYFYHVYKR